MTSSMKTMSKIGNYIFIYNVIDELIEKKEELTLFETINKPEFIPQAYLSYYGFPLLFYQSC
mgnify:CR=1 FL=1